MAPHTSKKERKGHKIRLQVSTAKKTGGKGSGIVTSENTPVKIFGNELNQIHTEQKKRMNSNFSCVVDT